MGPGIAQRATPASEERWREITHPAPRTKAPFPSVEVHNGSQRGRLFGESGVLRGERQGQDDSLHLYLVLQVPLQVPL
jgi:hypothetical protein